MNVNALIQELETVTGLDVSPDIYTGTDSSYIVYAYEDEVPSDQGDDEVLTDTAYLSVNLYTPPKLNYMAYKSQIKDYLESIGIVTSVRSYLDTFTSGGEDAQIRHTVFEVEITISREKTEVIN